MMNDIILVNGLKMPPLGLGTYPLKGALLSNVVSAAYKLGYRLIDTSDNYYNEHDLGVALQSLYKETNAKREEMFLVSKLSDDLYEPGTLGGGANKGIYFWENSPIMQQANSVHKVVMKKIENSLNSLKTDCLDLLLMHWPYPDYFPEIWYEMEQLYKDGKVKAIGVCNFRIRHFEKLRESCTIFPMVNQIESSPLNTKVELIEYCKKEDVQIMTYSPLMSLRIREKDKYNDFLEYLCDKHKKNKGQIILRFNVQRGLIPIPKSSREVNLYSNINIFDFELSNDDMVGLMNFNEDLQTLPESKSCPGL